MNSDFPTDGKGYMCCTTLNQAIILIRDVLLKVSITAGLGEAQ